MCLKPFTPLVLRLNSCLPPPSARAPRLSYTSLAVSEEHAVLTFACSSCRACQKLTRYVGTHLAKLLSALYANACTAQVARMPSQAALLPKRRYTPSMTTAWIACRCSVSVGNTCYSVGLPESCQRLANKRSRIRQAGHTLAAAITVRSNCSRFAFSSRRFLAPAFAMSL